VSNKLVEIRIPVHSDSPWQAGRRFRYRFGTVMGGTSFFFAQSILFAATLAAGAADAGLALEVRRVDGSIRLSWAAQANHRYRVESATSLGSAWSTAADVPSGAAAAEVTWTDTNAVSRASTRFYRLLDQGAVAAGALTEEAAYRASDLVPFELGDLYNRSARDTSDAIQYATALAPFGSPPVTHGTLRLTGNANNPVQYEPLPADHFVLIPIQGPQVEVYVQQLDLARGIYQWRQVGNGSDLVLRSEPGLQATLARVTGRYAPATFPGVTFEVDLTGAISGFSEVDSTGTHQLSDMSVTGTVSAPGFVQTVRTRDRFEFVSTRGLSGKLQSSSTSENWNNNTVVWGGATYVWNNVKRQRSFRDGKESDLDTYWNALGTLTRNGVEFGRYRKVLNTVGTAVIDLRFQVVLADRVVDVEKWIVQVPASGR
jgi:hypothetical protein